MTRLLLVMAFAGGISAQQLFDFHSNFWLDLHLRVYDDANSKRAAPDYYAREIVKHNLLDNFSAEIDNRISRWEDATSLENSGLAPELIAALEAAAPAYRAKWPE